MVSICVGVGFTVSAEALAKEDPTRGRDESRPYILNDTFNLFVNSFFVQADLSQ